MTMDRRHFLRLLGLGAGATAAGLVLPDVEPVRRFWQVGRGAPVLARGPVNERFLDVLARAMAGTLTDTQRTFARLTGTEPLPDVSPEHMRRAMLDGLDRLAMRESLDEPSRYYVNDREVPLDVFRSAAEGTPLEPRVATYDVRDLSIEMGGRVHRQDYAKLVIGTRPQHPPPLVLATGDDVRRAFGSSAEGLAQLVDHNRAQPVAVYRLDEG